MPGEEAGQLIGLHEAEVGDAGLAGEPALFGPHAGAGEPPRVGHAAAIPRVGRHQQIEPLLGGIPAHGEKLPRIPLGLGPSQAGGLIRGRVEADEPGLDGRGREPEKSRVGGRSCTRHKRRLEPLQIPAQHERREQLAERPVKRHVERKNLRHRAEGRALGHRAAHRAPPAEHHDHVGAKRRHLVFERRSVEWLVGIAKRAIEPGEHRACVEGRVGSPREFDQKLEPHARPGGKRPPAGDHRRRHTRPTENDVHLAPWRGPVVRSPDQSLSSTVSQGRISMPSTRRGTGSSDATIALEIVPSSRMARNPRRS